MIPKAYQIETAEQGTALLKKYGLVYLSDQERVGKTLPSLMILENVKARKVLVLTKKQAIGGWLETIRKYEYLHSHLVILRDRRYGIASRSLHVKFLLFLYQLLLMLKDTICFIISLL